ncbi:MAG TPA: LacI family DNA-binding transcriptional regulator [Chthoniobacteraceae bacterium]|nr:LacI family DNA-binding transcriptional regulator [Chthoniobacteraceae bacterium]
MARTLPPLRKISRKTGASVTTVSRVLNGHPNVSPKMREEVLAALREHGYQSKPIQTIARPAAAKHRTLAFAITTEIKSRILEGNLFYTRHLIGFQSACAAAHCYPLLIDHEQDATVEGGLQCVEEGKVYGVVAEKLPPERLEILRGKVPVVLFNVASDVPFIDSVLPDVRQAAHEQLDLLHGLGHRSIACFRVYPGGWQDQRYWAEFLFHGIHLGLDQPAEFFQPFHFPLRGEVAAIKLFLDRVLSCPRPPTAIVTYDTYVSALIAECAARGLKVPDDISIVGYDDDPAQTPVPLTTYRQNFETMAREAVRLIADRAENPESPGRTVIVKGEMVVRQSTGPAPAR